MSQPPAQPTDQTAVLAALRLLLLPMARLAVARGLPYAAIDGLLREALVEAAKSLHEGQPAHGLVSRVSTATGLSRREANKLLHSGASAPAGHRWLAGDVFTRWLGDPVYQREGRPRVLQRQGPAPSFESLAQSVTRDVHARSLLDELRRLGLARLDEATDTVTLEHDALVPRGDFARMLGFLGDNVGDHLRAAVANVLGDGSAHFEQAIDADELSADSVAALRALISAQWQVLFQQIVPQLERLIADDRATGRAQDQRVRIGLYSFTAATTPAAPLRPGEPDKSPR